MPSDATVAVPRIAQAVPLDVNEPGAAFWFTRMSPPPPIRYGALLARLLCGVHVAATWYCPDCRLLNVHWNVSWLASVNDWLNFRSFP